MHKILIALLLAVCGARAACTTLSLPIDYLTVAGLSRANLSTSLAAIRDAHNSCKDSTNAMLAVMSGFNGNLQTRSLGDLHLQLDSDNNGTNRFVITNGGMDSVWRVGEDSTWRAWGAGVGTKLTLSDSILAATARISGNGYFGGTLTGAGATSLAGLSATTGSFSSTLTANAAMIVGASGTLTLSYMTDSRIPYTAGSGGMTSTSNLTYTPGTTTFATANGNFSGTVVATGLLTASGGITYGGIGAEANASIFTAASGGLKIRGATGSTYDLTIEGAGGNDVMRVPTGTTNIQIPNGTATFGQTVTITAASLQLASLASTLGIQSDVNTSYMSLSGGNASNAGANLLLYGGSHATLANNFYLRYGSTNILSWDASASRLQFDVGDLQANIADHTANAVDIQQGSNNYINVNTTNSSENVSIGNATTNPTVSLLGTGLKTIDGAITASSTGAFTGKLGTADSLYAEDGLRVGATAASNVNWNRSGANMWNTPDSVTVAGRLAVSDSISTGGNEKFAHDRGEFTGTLQGCTTAPTTTCRYSIIAAIVSVQCDFVTETSDSTGLAISGVPSAILPTNGGGFAPISHAYDNGANVSNASVYIDNNQNSFRFALNGSTVGWMASGTKGLGNAVYFTYLIR